MSRPFERLGSARFDVLLCDADGNLFPSEEPAFEASAAVTNRLLEEIGVRRRFDPAELRLATTGLNFRTTAARLAVDAGRPLDEERLERWVDKEKRAVSEHLGRVLRPDASVTRPLARLGRRFELAAVSSSALSRLDVCFRATGLDERFPHERRFSAEDSLRRPTSKPDPAVYLHALDAMSVAPARALAIEDSVPGACSAVAAGIPTIGNLMFVPPDERSARADALAAAGADGVVGSWRELEGIVAAGTHELVAAG